MALIFIFKSILYGFLIIAMPSFAGVNIKKRYIEIPIVASKAMLGLFATIFIVEVVSLILQFL